MVVLGPLLFLVFQVDHGGEVAQLAGILCGESRLLTSIGIYMQLLIKV